MPPENGKRRNGADDRRDWRTVMPSLVGVALCGALAILNEVRDFNLWRNYAVAGLFMGSLLTWVLWHKDVRIPHYIQWMIVVAVMLHFGGGSTGSPVRGEEGLLEMRGINGAYHVYPWWDNLTHIAGTLAATLGFAYLLEMYQLRRRLGWSPRTVFAFSLTAGLATGVGVELYEYLGKTLFQTIDQGGYYNTMGDLVSNLVGATVGATVGVAVNRTLFWPSLQDQWGEQVPVRPGWPRVPAHMVGVLAFIIPAAATSLFLAIRFLIQDGAETEEAYEHALRVLTRSAVAGAVAAPAAAMAANELRRRLARPRRD